MAKLAVTLTRSMIGRPENQRVTVRTLGLNKMHQTVVVPDNDAMRGMINHVSHLLTVKEIQE
ncbi:50S ribosomal protein L30 [Exiguobacterium flavidum]|uniref:50S ribosomal protein L30 n=1 Tax=Exiguobacterium flavidum TaxID=2184695 RepID=UPI000DF86835|nr:50S ribosomal protein L30 [Exiguobacterium flavidum]